MIRVHYEDPTIHYADLPFGTTFRLPEEMEIRVKTTSPLNRSAQSVSLTTLAIYEISPTQQVIPVFSKWEFTNFPDTMECRFSDIIEETCFHGEEGTFVKMPISYGQGNTFQVTTGIWKVLAQNTKVLPCQAHLKVRSDPPKHQMPWSKDNFTKAAVNVLRHTTRPLPLGVLLEDIGRQCEFPKLPNSQPLMYQILVALWQQGVVGKMPNKETSPGASVFWVSADPNAPTFQKKA
jgi:hypothetical protein